ncbi:MAG: hypothetical protein IPM00_13840 [Tetrasphaera sp.]|nr:hypothetical protein [Tetrasphaera sp.]
MSHRPGPTASHDVVTADRYAVGADLAAGQAERDALWRRLDALTPAQRAVLVLRYYADLSGVGSVNVSGRHTESALLVSFGRWGRGRHTESALLVSFGRWGSGRHTVSA